MERTKMPKLFSGSKVDGLPWHTIELSNMLFLRQFRPSKGGWIHCRTKPFLGQRLYPWSLIHQSTTVMISTKILIFVNRFAAVGETRVCAWSSGDVHSRIKSGWVTRTQTGLPELVYDWGTSLGVPPFCNRIVSPSSKRLHSQMWLHQMDIILLSIICLGAIICDIDAIGFVSIDTLVASCATVP